MTIDVRRSRPDDHPAILSLMDRARGEGLNDEERARRGFVQGSMSGELLDRFARDPGIFVADEAGELAGFAMTSEPGLLPPEHPASAAVRAVTATTEGHDPGRLFLYGPVAVDERFQGRGVLTKLLTGLSHALESTYDLGVAFVETTNERSLTVHRHYGMTETPPFDTVGRTYVAFSFPPAAFTHRHPDGPAAAR
ncbi:GNAT family N-acetyltransferase [Streptomyces sp. NPDC026672]|uniref:GNAT family N-acetyltransferase n=1 Tax=unclassified Streptomyces TaxID=2593676 RepID=UPI0033E3792B